MHKQKGWRDILSVETIYIFIISINIIIPKLLRFAFCFEIKEATLRYVNI